MTETKISAPVPHFELKVGEETKTILMSFGLINRLAEQLTLMENEPEVLKNSSLSPGRTRAIICSHILTLDEDGRPHPDKYDEFVHTKGTTTENMQLLFGWVNDHLTDFFITSQEQTSAALRKQEDRMRTLNQNATNFSEKLTVQKSS